jgi:predicted phage tail protein
MIACNAAQLGSFLKGMEESGSVAGTALSTAANFVTAAAYGRMLWGETFVLQWWIGLSMVMTGVALLTSVQAKEETLKKRD